MGYVLRCAIARCTDDDQAARLLAAAASLPHAIVRRFRDPFDGVIAGSHYLDVWDAYTEDPAKSGYASEDDAMAAIYDGIEGGLPALSRRFPGVRFAYIDVDCFGGTCLYGGHVVVDGSDVFRLPGHSQRGHVELLARLGVTIDWHFAPFTRGFLTGEDKPGPIRRAIAGVIDGELRFTLPALTMHLRAELAPPWAMPIIARDTLVLTYADDDLLLSLNATGHAIAFGGRAHVGPDEAAVRLDELLRCLDEIGVSYDVALSDFQRAPLRRWRR